MELSYSSIDVFDQCKRWFYLLKIKKQRVKEDTKYLDRGTVVHSVIEYYYTTKCDDETLFQYYNQKWKEYNLDKTFSQQYLKTWDMIQNAVKKNIKFTYIEYKIRLSKPSVIGFMDIINSNTHEIWDWKTSVPKNMQEYESQMKMYSYLYYKAFGYMPIATVIYLGPNKEMKYNFTKSIIEEQENKIVGINNFVENYKNDLNAFLKVSDNPKKCPHFCPYKNECFNNVNDFVVGNENAVKIIIKNNSCFLQGFSHPVMLEVLDQELKYDKKEKYFMQKNVTKYGIRPGTPEYEDYGTVHLFNKNYKMFNIGSLETVKKVIEEYAIFSKKEIKIEIDDQRNSNVMNKKLGTMPDKLKTTHELRNYQNLAINKWLETGMGFLEMATGSGKTMVTAELIRRLDTITLWIVDRKEILYQTRDVFSEMLGVRIGIIGDSETDVQDITVATIQTLYSKLDALSSYLNSVNFVIVDEAHHAAALTYQKVFVELKNTKYRLGTTATTTRDDGDSPILLSLIGPIVYKISSKELETEGYLMKPKVVFFKTDGEYDPYLPYAEAYTKYVVNNEQRNFMINNIVKELPNKKILILTTRIEHGKKLLLLIENSNFLCGSTNKDTRKNLFNDFKLGKFNVLIGTQSIFSEGIDIPDLDVIINTTSNKGDVKTIQSLGRVLRKSKGKEQALYIDFIDVQKYLNKASMARRKILLEEGHEIEYQ